MNFHKNLSSIITYSLIIQEIHKCVLLAKSEDSDEITHSAAFHQSLHCLLRRKQSQVVKNNIVLEILRGIPTCDPLICINRNSKLNCLKQDGKRFCQFSRYFGKIYMNSIVVSWVMEKQ